MHIQNAQIASVHLATEVLECAIVLRTGEVVVYKLAGSGVPAGLPTTLEDPELLSLKHVPVGDGQQFYPQFMIMTGRGPVSSCAISDIGMKPQVSESTPTHQVPNRIHCNLPSRWFSVHC